MPATKITATEAARNFSDVLNRVEYKGESFVIERNGRVIGRIEPDRRGFTGTDLADLLDALPTPDPEFGNDVLEARQNQGSLPERDW